MYVSVLRLATVWPTSSSFPLCLFTQPQRTLHNNFSLLSCVCAHHCDVFALASRSECTFVAVLPQLAKTSIFRFLCQCLCLFFLLCLSQSYCVLAYTLVFYDLSDRSHYSANLWQHASILSCFRALCFSLLLLQVVDSIITWS